MKLTRTVEIGLASINALKTLDKSLKLSEVAQIAGSTPYFTVRVMKDLRNAGLITAKKGPGGGYTINKSVGTITAYQVAVAVGKSFGMSDDDSPRGRLNKAIVASFKDTVV